MKNTTMQSTELTDSVITPSQLLEHWQGHRRVTRRLIEAFPEDKFLTYSIGSMRPFSELVKEMLDMAVPGLQGIVTGKWQNFSDLPLGSGKQAPKTRKDFLRLWDEATEQINELWPQIPPHRFQEVDTAFGQWKGLINWILFYSIDNEIHHRGQGYVYLRSLGIEPPAFWDRS